MRKFIAALGYVSAVLVVLSGCRTTENSKIRLLIDWKWEPTYIGFLAARDQGFFKEEGLDVDIIEGNGATVANQLVAAGKEVIASCSGAASIIGYDKGAHTLSLATLYPNTPTVFYALEGTSLSGPNDLIGKTVGLIPESISYHEYITFCQANGLDRSRINEISVGWDVTPLLTKRVDVLMQYEELTPISLLVDGSAVVTLPLREHGVQLVSLNIIVNPRWYESNPTKAKKVAKAVIEGYRWAIRNPKEATDLFLRAQPQMKRDYVKESLAHVKSLIGPEDLLGSQDLKKWEDSAKTIASLGLTDRVVDVRRILITR